MKNYQALIILIALFFVAQAAWHATAKGIL